MRIPVVLAVIALMPAYADDAAKKLVNPVAYTAKSIGAGKNTFVRMCSSCHGMDGKSTIDVVADATDLTDPKAWKSGTAEGEIFVSIRDGQGASMPAFKTQLKSEEEHWQLVNFILSLWPEDARPAGKKKPVTKEN